MGHKLIRIIQVTPMIVAMLMTLIVTVMDCDVVWAKAGRGVWGLCHAF